MYVCICAKITQSDIQQAIAAGHNTHGKLKNELNVCSNCCKCAQAVQREIDGGEEI